MRNIWIILMSMMMLGCNYHNQDNSAVITPKQDFLLTANGQVGSISDGDTLVVTDNEKRRYVVRLQAIDAPERSQIFGRESKQKLEELAKNKTVTIKITKKDQYQRFVGYVFIGELDLGLKMIEDGYAWHFKQFENDQLIEDRSKYAYAEEQAKSKKVGLWQVPIPPWEFRKIGGH